MTDPVCGKEIEVGPDTLSTDCHGRTLYFCSRACLEKFVCEPEKKLADYLYDLIIVGGGPAGLSAGIYAGLGGIHTLFLSKSVGGQAWDSTSVRNFPGFEMITGPDLVARFRTQLFDSIHLAHQFCEVTALHKEGPLFRVTTATGEVYRARTVLLATGMKRRRMNIPGEETFHGRGVGSFHAISAPRYKDKPVVVVGGGNSAAQAALGLFEAGAKVTVVARTFRPDLYLKERVEAAPIKLVTGFTPKRIEWGETVTGITACKADGSEERFQAEAVFVEIGLIPNSELVKDLAVLNERGEIQVDSNCCTGLPGLYAAGDVTSTYGKRILIAAGEGAKAVLAIEDYLRSLGVRE